MQRALKLELEVGLVGTCTMARLRLYGNIALGVRAYRRRPLVASHAQRTKQIQDLACRGLLGHDGTR